MGRARTALVGGLAIIVLGIAASSFAAAEWRSSALEANKKSFESTAAVLGSALDAKLSANVALTRTMRAHASMETQEDETQYLQWYRELQRGASSSPDVVATFIQVIPASGLPTFRREVERDRGLAVVLADVAAEVRGVVAVQRDRDAGAQQAGEVVIAQILDHAQLEVG